MPPVRNANLSSNGTAARLGIRQALGAARLGPSMLAACAVLLAAAPTSAQIVAPDQMLSRQRREGLLRDALQPPLMRVTEELLPPRELLSRTPVSEEVQAAVADLDHDSWARREEAARVLRDGSFADEELMAVLTRETLSPEQRHRVLAVLAERLSTAPRGALGIQMQRDFSGRPGVLISAVIPGMPAEKVLRRDDRIMSINDRPIFDSDVLVGVIQLERPGQKVRLAVERPKPPVNGVQLRAADGEPLTDRVEVELELGSVDDLERFEPVGPAGVPIRGAGARIVALRAEQIREAFARFGPPTVDVTVVGRQLAPVALLLDPEQHPAIETLRTYRRLIGEGVVTISPPMRAMWSQTLRDLVLQAEQPDLDQATRRYLRAVVEQYADLLPR